MEVMAGVPLGLDVTVDAPDLLGGEVGGRDGVRRRDAVIEGVEAKVQNVIGDGEVEFLLRLRQGVGVGGGGPPQEEVRLGLKNPGRQKVRGVMCGGC